MKNILIFQKAGTIHINPNLSAIVKTLCDNGYCVDLVSFLYSAGSQKWNYPNANLFYLDINPNVETLSDVKKKLSKNYSFVFGIDGAIVQASNFAKKHQIPYGLISYEIFFADELGIEEKKAEIIASKDISFAVSQDATRALLLSKENKIKFESILQVPVADIYQERKKTNQIRDYLNIPSDKNIALFNGMLSKRTMVDSVFEFINKLDENWVLVIQSPTKIEEKQINDYRKKYNLDRVIFSNIELPTTDDLYNFISSADIGIAFSSPIATGNKFDCKNILFIGLSSGKIAANLMCGIPVVVNEIGEMSDLVRKYKIGVVIDNMSEFNLDKINQLNEETITNRCKDFYKKKLDFNLYAKELIGLIHSAIQNSEFKYSGMPAASDYSSINMIISYFNEIIKLKKRRFTFYQIKSQIKSLFKNNESFDKKYNSIINQLIN